ncbi:MAG: HAD family hydrolase [Verrucomicrobia bacterium]|nr:HAD family hydrolase [Verrucomicrobiota bacterium]
MLRAILFDFDQTLVNSAPGFRQAEHWLQREMHGGLRGVDWEPFLGLYRQIRDAPRQDESPAAKRGQWRQVCQHFGATPDRATWDAWEAGYWQRVEAGTAPLPGAVELLARLRARFALGLVTNAASTGGQGLRCRKFPGLLACFQAVVVCGEDGLPPKPAPAGILRAVAALNVGPPEAVLVGDNWETDVLGARAAGVFPVWLRHASIVRRAPETVPDDIPLLDSLQPLARLQPGDSPEQIRVKLRSTV